MLCDVTPMDTTHVLLGRPWQYDHRATYDGYRNTYTIQKDDQYFKMLLMTRVDVLQEQFVHVKTKCQRSLFLFPCKLSQKKKKPPQKTLDESSLRNHQATNQQGMTSGLVRDQINDERMKSKQGELKKNTRETKLKSTKEDWRSNMHGRKVHS